MDAFRRISGLRPITSATADDCAAFQRKALTLAKNWRQKYPKGKKEVGLNCCNGKGTTGVTAWQRSPPP
jgi:hypothetical protein